FYPANAKIAQIDNRGENLGRRTRVDLGLVGDVKATLELLLPKLAGNADSAHLDRASQHYHRARRDLDDLAVGRPGRKPIHPQYVARKLSELATPDAIFTADVGTPTIWAARYLQMNGQRRLLGSFNHGSMASALPHAIGAQAAYPGRQVISLSGDGGFAMLMGEFLTLTQMKLPVKVVVFNNGVLGFVSLEMKASGFLPEGVELQNPDFAKLAEAAGALGIRVEDPADVEAAVTRALAHDGPALLDMVTNPTELAMPPRATMEQMKGFGLYLTRAILNGRGDEVMELARTNLWR
ncbi:MAG: thiamine pyrophosphate-dependent enzyme, partial [Pseudomonadota bacterium]|nr:thiamine pyrophosphate-dependent enzyme [Pseudomonadota bacterium]